MTAHHRNGNLTIAVDFDHTYSADPETFSAMISLFQGAGHRVVLVTKRPDTPEMREEVESLVGRPDMLKIFVGNSGIIYKDPMVKEFHDLDVDIWIDDKPEFIRSPDQLKDELDDLIGKHFFLTRELEASLTYVHHLEGVLKAEAKHLWEDLKAKFKR